jgi:hypothetical protein
MQQFNHAENYWNDPTPKNKAKNLDEIAREIVDYSFQKDAYQGHRIEGDYLVAYVVDKARWLQYHKDGIPVVEKPRHENAYIGIAVHRASDFRFIKNLKVVLTVFDEYGRALGSQEQVYHPRPGLHHYGRNWSLPGDGSYTLRVRIDALDIKGDPISPAIVDVEFPHVMIHTGQLIS